MLWQQLCATRVVGHGHQVIRQLMSHVYIHIYKLCSFSGVCISDDDTFEFSQMHLLNCKDIHSLYTFSPVDISSIMFFAIMIIITVVFSIIIITIIVLIIISNTLIIITTIIINITVIIFIIMIIMLLSLLLSSEAALSLLLVCLLW